MSSNWAFNHQHHPPPKAGTLKSKGGKVFTWLHKHMCSNQDWWPCHKIDVWEQIAQPTSGQEQKAPWSTDQKGQHLFRELHLLFLVIFSFHLSAEPSFQPQPLVKSLWPAIAQVWSNTFIYLVLSQSKIVAEYPAVQDIVGHFLCFIHISSKTLKKKFQPTWEASLPWISYCSLQTLK